MILDMVGWLCMVLGAFFIFTGAIGMLRMPDFYTRMHPAGVAESLGVPLILVGLMIHSGVSLYSGKLFFLMLFLMITGPTATHVVAKSAMISGLKPRLNVRKK